MSRQAPVRDGWNYIACLWVMALLIDALCQLPFPDRFYLLEGVIVTGIAAVALYVVLRGPMPRLVRPRRWL